MKQRLKKLENAVKAAGADLIIEQGSIIDSEHLDAFWYDSGVFASLKYKDFTCSFTVQGDVSLTLLDELYEEVLFKYYKQPNQSAFRNPDVLKYLKDDKSLRILAEQGRLEWGLNNWIEVHITDEDGIEYSSTVLDTSNILEALEEAKSLIPELDQCELEGETALQNMLSIKDWYTSTYPKDASGAELPENLSFINLYGAILAGENFYEVIGVWDATVREHLFHKIAEIENISYDALNALWLNPERTSISVLLHSIDIDTAKETRSRKPYEEDFTY